jgi:phosphopantothenoylcysteine decarboxylase/phosphopantothenate--cysteine ligase
MNARMWLHPATQANLALLRSRGIAFVGPNDGDMACGEWGPGRMAEPEEIVEAIGQRLNACHRLTGRRALVTSGPTREPIDPVRFLSNRSSGRQGHAIAEALGRLGATTTLVTGPTGLADPDGVRVVHVETAAEMLAACEAALPADVAVCAAAVSDWRVSQQSSEKIKKTADGVAPLLSFSENPDILASLSRNAAARPRLVVGFAAETTSVIDNGVVKRNRKGCDWIVANDVSPSTGTFGGERNRVHLITATSIEDWPEMSKREVAERLADRIADALEGVA